MMPKIASLCLAAAILGPGSSAEAGNTGLPVRPLDAALLDRLRWQARPVVVLGPDGQVAAQIASLQAEAPALAERDVILLTDGPGAAALRTGDDTGFRVLLIGKDGGVKLARDQAVAPAEIIALIDSMPMRRREMRKP